MSVASQSGIRPIDVNGGEEVVAVGGVRVQRACRKKRRKRLRQEERSEEY